MFEAKIDDIRLLRDSIETIAQLIDEAVLRVKPSGVELTATDRAKVALVNFKMTSKAFSEYKCEGDIDIGLNILNFLTILKRVGNDDKTKIRFDKNEQRLEVIIEGRSVRKFAIPVLDISSEELSQIINLDFPSEAEVQSDIIEQGISDGDIIADSMLFTVEKERFMMVAEGDGSKVEVNISSPSVKINSSRDVVKSLYPLDYLKKIIKAARISDTVKILMGSDYPMKMEFKNPAVELSFVVAPRVLEE